MKKNKSHANGAIKAGLGYTLGNILVNGIVFLSVPIFTRLLSTSEFGIYSSFMTYQSIFAMIIGLTLHTSLKNAKYDYCNERNVYHSSILTLMLIIFIVFLLFGVTCRASLGKLLSVPSYLIPLLIVYSFSSALMMFFNSALVLDYNYKSYLLASLFFSVISISLSIFFILYIFTSAKALGRILGGVIPISLVGCYILVYFFRIHRPIIRKDCWIYGLKISLPLVPHGLSQLVLTQFDRVMILRIIGEAEAGIYSLAYTLAMVLQIIFSSLDSIWNTWFFEHMASSRRNIIKSVSRYYVIFISIFTVMFFLVSPEIIKVFAEKNYWDAQYVVIPIALSLYFSFLYFFPVGIEYYYKKTIFVAIGTTSAAILNILLNLIFLPLYGYMVASLTTLISYIFYFVFHLFIAYRIERCFVFDLKTMVICLMMTSLMALLSYIAIGLPIVRWAIFLIMIVFVLIFGFTKRKYLIKLLKKESAYDV